MSTIAFESERFGPIEVDAGALLQFDEGLIGIPGRDWVLIAQRADAAILWLQSVEDPALALPVAVPETFYPDYAPVVDDATLMPLAQGDELPLEILCVVNASSGDLERFTINLRAPLLINPITGHGLQAINDADEYAVAAPLWGAVEISRLRITPPQLPTVLLEES